MKRYRNFFIAATTALFSGLYLWFYSDLPPYGSLGNELSNHSWGIVVDIAHKWRSLDFHFWDRGVGGGTCLYSSGFYPLFDPANGAAWFLNDELFFKFKIIEPYVIGIGLAVGVLLQTFSLRWPYAIFGGWLYMGLGFGRFATLSDAPYFLWGCALFPALIYALGKFKDRNDWTPAVGAGVVLSLQFFTEGAPQFLQIFLWTLIFLTVQSLWIERGKNGSIKSTFNIWGWRCFLFIFFSLGLSAVQFLPTFQFAFFDSARAHGGQYSINNFPLFPRGPFESKGSVFGFFSGLIISPGGVSWRGVIALAILAVGFIFSYKKSFIRDIQNSPVAIVLFLTTFLYFLVPSLAGFLADIFSWFAAILRPMSYLTFAYGVHILDFCAVLCLAFTLDRAEQLAYPRKDKKNLVSFFWIGGAILFAALPLLMVIPGLNKVLLSVSGVFDSFVPASIKSAAVIFILTLLLIFYFVFKPGQNFIKYAALGALIGLGFMTMVLSFNWNNKGRQTHWASYEMDSPEVQYYHHAAGKFYLPFHDLYSMSHNLNLLYNVEGTAGFLQIPPKRFNQFMAAYHNEKLKTQEFWWVPKYTVVDPSGALASRFPVDFTTIKKDQNLDWPGFVKKVSGKNFDVWEKEGPPARVYFADTLQIAEFDQVIAGYDEPFGHVMHVTKKDANAFGIAASELTAFKKDKPQSSDFVRLAGAKVRFKAHSLTEVFMMVPEIFQNGWHVIVDGKRAAIFPAEHLFIGFKMPAGQHSVFMKFTPPYFYLGLVISIFSLIVLILNFVKRGPL